MTYAELSSPGFDHALADIRTHLPNLRIAFVIDVGAHVGEMSCALATAFPDARIKAFEPTKKTCQTLARNLKPHRKAAAVNMALGATSGSARVLLSPHSSTANTIVPEGDPSGGDLVEVITGDEYCATMKIPRVSFLKIDTEGSELEVLAGFRQMLTSQAIDLIQLEAGVNPDNHKHVPLVKLIAFMNGFGYRVFGFYSQALEKNSPVLRRLDAIFVSDKARRLGRRQHKKRESDSEGAA